jgi:hypothetical protein
LRLGKGRYDLGPTRKQNDCGLVAVLNEDESPDAAKIKSYGYTLGEYRFMGEKLGVTVIDIEFLRADCAT